MYIETKIGSIETKIEINLIPQNAKIIFFEQLKHYFPLSTDRDGQFIFKRVKIEKY